MILICYSLEESGSKIKRGERQAKREQVLYRKAVEHCNNTHKKLI
jgi:hypothetical protein